MLLMIPYYMYSVPRMLFILKHYIKDLAYCMHAIINMSPIVGAL